MLNQNNSSTATAIQTGPLSLRDKVIIYGGVFLVSLVGWVYMFYMGWAMENMDLVDMWMPPMGGTRAWDVYDFWMLFVMWAVMMVAMMTPSVVPMVMMFATINKGKQKKGLPYAPTFIFLSGYLVAWALFSIVASAIQYPLHVSGLLNPMMNSRSYLLSGGILVLAGLYQWTPLKDACLTECRSPLSFLMTSWKEGHWGALRLGVHHGLYCIGCCWALMAVLFAVGVMNMLWVLLITIFVVLEKIGPVSSRYLRAVTGLIMVIWGGFWLSLYPWKQYDTWIFLV
jgi:predicted metal-binding membrane protein